MELRLASGSRQQPTDQLRLRLCAAKPATDANSSTAAGRINHSPTNIALPISTTLTAIASGHGLACGNHCRSASTSNAMFSASVAEPPSDPADVPQVGKGNRFANPHTLPEGQGILKKGR